MVFDFQTGLIEASLSHELVLLLINLFCLSQRVFEHVKGSSLSVCVCVCVEGRGTQRALESESSCVRVCARAPVTTGSARVTCVRGVS